MDLPSRNRVYVIKFKSKSESDSEPRTKEKRGGFAYFTRYFSGTFHISSISASVFPWSFNFRLLQISAFSEQTWPTLQIGNPKAQ
jgi:hypothetical protein